MSMAEKTEAEVIVEVAQDATDPFAVDVATVYAAPSQRHIIDLERFLPAPRRTRGAVELHTAGSLGAYVIRHKDEAATTLYASEKDALVVAVLNDAEAFLPGWGDHRATLRLRQTDPWKHWHGSDGDLMSQTSFAEHIEAGLPEITDPPALDMLELAQTFEAATSVAFKSASRLADGQRALHYEETIEARAGQTGSIVIPKTLGLTIVPYEGSEPFELSARFRYRLNGGKLTLGYVLVRPNDVLRQAFEDALAAIERDTELTAFHGSPPVRG
jgi:uncharacterized protein YfdQ (DUF2303 family)